MMTIPKFINDTFENASKNAYSAFDAGYYTFTGTYVKKDIKKALEYFTMSEQMGNIDAINYIYYCNIILNGTNEYISKLEDNSLESAIASDILFSIYSEGIYEKQDMAKAIKYKEQYINQINYFKKEELENFIELCLENNFIEKANAYKQKLLEMDTSK